MNIIESTQSTASLISQSNAAAWFSGIATLITGMIALCIAVFGDTLKSIFYKPKLLLDIKLKSPDCHKIAITKPDGTKLFDTYYFRFNITNEGNSQAQDVEVKLLKLWEVHDEGNTEDPAFLPINLVWAHTQEIYGNRITMPKIQPKMFKYCDFFHIIPTKDNTYMIMFDTEVTPNPVENDRYPTIIKQGKYLVDLVVVANNHKPMFRTVSVDYNGKWFENEKEMFTNAINVNIAK